jgi:hypothetical protein
MMAGKIRHQYVDKKYDGQHLEGVENSILEKTLTGIVKIGFTAAGQYKSPV